MQRLITQFDSPARHAGSFIGLFILGMAFWFILFAITGWYTFNNLYDSGLWYQHASAGALLGLLVGIVFVSGFSFLPISDGVFMWSIIIVPASHAIAKQIKVDPVLYIQVMCALMIVGGLIGFLVFCTKKLRALMKKDDSEKE
jgi:hypothetical protein